MPRCRGLGAKKVTSAASDSLRNSETRKRSYAEAHNAFDERVEAGQRLLGQMQLTEPVLSGCEVGATPGDGLCFLHAVLQQLQVEASEIVWKLVVIVLHAMVGSREQ